ncbi:MAG: hypothetical protein UV58_C0011G0035, partial [Candidatus Wolfebacteria bacterium GW2011_GWC1_43_10]
FLTAQSAHTFVHIELIAEKHSSLHPALRTPSRRRHIYFFIEIKILRFYDEI